MFYIVYNGDFSYRKKVISECLLNGKFGLHTTFRNTLQGHSI